MDQTISVRILNFILTMTRAIKQYYNISQGYEIACGLMSNLYFNS